MQKRKKNRLELRFLVAVVGFILVALELILGFSEVALYQSLTCSVYLLFNILFEISRWSEKRKSEGYGLWVIEGRLIFVATVSLFWFLSNWLLGLIAPRLSETVVWLLSFAMIAVSAFSILFVSFYRSLTKKRKFIVSREVTQRVHESTRKRRRFRKASMRTVILLSPIMILAGIPLFYLGWFTSVLHKYSYGLLQAQVGAFGMTLIVMGVLFPIIRLLQERSHKLKRAARA